MNKNEYDLYKNCPPELKEAIDKGHGLMMETEHGKGLITDYCYYNDEGKEKRYKYYTKLGSSWYFSAKLIQEEKPAYDSIEKDTVCAFFDSRNIQYYIINKYIKYCIYPDNINHHKNARHSIFKYAVPLSECKDYIHITPEEWPKELKEKWGIK